MSLVPVSQLIYLHFYWGKYLTVLTQGFSVGMFSRGSSVGIAMGCGLDGRGWIPGRGKRYFCTLQRPDRLWGPPTLLSQDTYSSFPGDKTAGEWSWLLVLPSSSAEFKNGGAIPPLPYTRLHGMLLSELNKGTAFPLFLFIFLVCRAYSPVPCPFVTMLCIWRRWLCSRGYKM
jgi:hypothetical protein